MKISALALLAAMASLPLLATASGDNHQHTASAPARDRAAMWSKSLARPPVAVSVAFDARGRLWRARVENGYLLVSRSTDSGASFGEPVRVNAEAERIAADGENRPKLAFGNKGEIFVSWTRSLETPFAGDVRFSRSTDDGASFAPPFTVNDDHQPIAHRFDALTVDGRGTVWVLWLDKRDQAAAEKAGGKFSGISLYAAQSTDGGATLSPNRRLAAHTCECCGIALDLDRDGVPVAAWRHVFGSNIRDHQIMRLDERMTPVRLSGEKWAVDACPHHGPTLAVARDGTTHAAWFTGAPSHEGLFYARSAGAGRTFSRPLAFGNNARQAGHPHLLAVGEQVFLAWKEFDGRSAVWLMRSVNGGKSWEPPARIADTEDASDRPWLVSDGKRVLLSWNTLKEGHRLLDVGAAVSGSPARDFVSGSIQAIQDAHRGRPYVVALWALDCAHCKENLALLARLSARYPDIDLVLIATDATDAGTVGDVLDHHGLAWAESWMFADGFAERLIYEVDPRWHGEVPRTYLFAPGQAVRAHTGRLDANVLQKWMSSQAHLAKGRLAQAGPVQGEPARVKAAQGEAP